MPDDDKLAINEAQLILAEKRTYLATLRTGIAVFVLPLSVVSFLIVFSKNYHMSKVWVYLVPLLLICTALAVLGGYLCVTALRRLIKADHALARVKQSSIVVSRDME